MSKIKPFACPTPWCRRPDPLVEEQAEKVQCGERITWSVSCPRCHVRTPDRGTKDFAIALWNKRPILPKCDCCQRRTPTVRFSAFHGEHAVCRACFFVWYDGVKGVDSTNPEEIGAYVRRASLWGHYPFTQSFQRDPPGQDVFES